MPSHGVTSFGGSPVQDWEEVLNMAAKKKDTTHVSFEVTVEINNLKSASSQIDECYLDDDRDEQMFEELGDKKFTELTKEQQEWASTLMFVAQVESDLPGIDYKYSYNGIKVVEVKEPDKDPVKKPAKKTAPKK